MISLSLGTRLEAVRAPAPPQGGLAPPMLAGTPALTGTGVIGMPVTIDPGPWEGRPAPVLVFRWLRNGRAIPGAEAPCYLPGAADDRALIACEVTGKNPAGTAKAISAFLAIHQPAPTRVGEISDQIFIQDSGVQTLSLISTFTGASLRFSVAGAAVSIDPDTGELSIPTDKLLDGAIVTLTATNSGGEVSGQFKLTVRLPDAAPELLAPPSIAGPVRVGIETIVDPGLWSGTPVPELGFEWLIDGTVVDGAVAAGYIPRRADDGRQLAARVHARNPSGSAEATTAELPVTLAPPQAAGELADVTLDLGASPVAVEAAADFTGEELTFAVVGTAARIDPATGRITLAGDTLVAGERITVTATNSGGSATSAFTLTVRPVQPSLVTAPALSGAGRIGAPVTVAPGVWAGAPAPILGLQWLRSGVEIAGATATTYVPVPADDLASLACRVTASNPAGTASALSTSLIVTHVPPAPTGTLADVSAGQGSGPIVVEAAPAFAGAALSFSVTGAGATINAATGQVRIPTTTLRNAVEVTVTARNSGGTATAAFKATVTTQQVLPVLIATPVLTGAGKIGQALTVTPGTWSGVPAPTTAIQWLRGDAPIAGATGATYTPGPVDDQAAITARVTASNVVGSATAVAAARTITYVAPTARGLLPEEVFDEDSGSQLVEASADFIGDNLSFTVTGAGATIDAATGRVSIPTANPLAGTLVTVAATNSGGTASSGFMVTVEAAAPGAPPPPTSQQWGIVSSAWNPAGQTQTFQPRVRLEASLGAQAAQWTTSAETPVPAAEWAALAATATANEYLTAGNGNLFQQSQARRDRFRIRYRTHAAGTWSEPSAAKTVPVPETEIAQWSRFYISSREAYENPTQLRYGKSGYQLQFVVGFDRSPVNPNKVAADVDISAGIITENAEAQWPYWYHSRRKGSQARHGIACRFDPDFENRIIYAISNRSPGAGGGGLYVTEDLGATLDKRLALSFIPGGGAASYDGKYRAYRRILDYAAGDHDKWGFFNADEGFYLSTDRGRNWSKVSSDPVSKNMGRCWYLAFRPGQDTVIYAACETGLWRSTNSGTTWGRLNVASLPVTDGVTSLNFNPANGNDFLAVSYGHGLYRTTDGGTSFTRVATPTPHLCQVAVSPLDRNYLWIVCYSRTRTNTNTNAKSYFSSNGGAAWQEFTYAERTYGWDVSDWQTAIRAPGKGGATDMEMQVCILPSPTKKERAIATGGCIMWRTENGRDWYNASDGWDNLAGGEDANGNIGFAPSDANRIYFPAFDYGPYYSENKGNWFARGNVGVADPPDHVSAMYTMRASPTNPDHLVGNWGSYMRPVTAVVSLDGARTWRRDSHFAANAEVASGWPDSLRQNFVAWHPSNGNIVVTQTAYSDNRGAAGSWTAWVDRETGNTFAQNCADGDAGVFGIAPSNGNVLYAFNNAMSQCYRSTDLGRNWALYTPTAGLPKSRRQPYSFAIHPTDAATIFWWTNGTGLRRFNGTSLSTHAAAWAHLRVGKVRISPLNPNHIYLFTGEDGQEQVIRSVNGVAGPWEDISGNLPQTGALRTLEIDPHTGILFVTGTVGTYIFAPPGGHATFTAWATRFGR